MYPSLSLYIYIYTHMLIWPRCGPSSPQWPRQCLVFVYVLFAIVILMLFVLLFLFWVFVISCSSCLGSTWGHQKGVLVNLRFSIFLDFLTYNYKDMPFYVYMYCMASAVLEWHHLSNATCLMRPDSFYASFVVSRITMIRYIMHHFRRKPALDKQC